MDLLRPKRKNQIALNVWGNLFLLDLRKPSWACCIEDVQVHSAPAFCAVQPFTIPHSTSTTSCIVISSPSHLCPSIFWAWIPTALSPISMTMDPSPPCPLCLSALVIKVNYAWIEGKSVSSCLDISSLEPHTLKAETLQRRFALAKVPLAWGSITHFFLLSSQSRNYLYR